MKAKSFLLKTQAILFALFLLAVICPFKSFNSYAYSNESKTFGVAGGSFTFTNSSVSTFSTSNWWISVDRWGSKFTVNVIKNNSTPHTYKSTRFAFVDFKDKNGNIVQRYNIYQDNPYIAVSKTSVVIDSLDSRSEQFTLTYNCPYTVKSSDSSVRLSLAYEYSPINNGGNNPLSYGKSNTVTVYVYSLHSPNYSDIKRTANIQLKYSYTGAVSTTITATQYPIFTGNSKYSCTTTSKGGTISIGIPKINNRKSQVCQVSNFNLPVASFLETKYLIFDYDKTPKSGYYASGDVKYSATGDLSLDSESEGGTFTISKDGKTMTLKVTVKGGKTESYKYKLS